MRNACARHEKPEARSQRPKRVCLEKEGLKFLAFSLRASRATSPTTTHNRNRAHNEPHQPMEAMQHDQFFDDTEATAFR